MANQQDVIDAIGGMRDVFRQYLSDVPDYQRREESQAIQVELDHFLKIAFVVLALDVSPVPEVCPRCRGKGRV